MIGAHPEVAMALEDTRHGIENVVGVKVWGNKLCIPNHITYVPKTNRRSFLKRLEDGTRAALGLPLYPSPADRRTCIRTYVEEKEACVVAILRRPNHVVDSMVRRGKDPEVAKDWWTQAVRAIGRVADEHPSQTYLISFSDLVGQPEEVMRNVSSFLGICFSSSMLSGHELTSYTNRGSIDEKVLKKDIKKYGLKEYDKKSQKIYSDLLKKARKP
jgi:hypothetical protein